MAFTTTAAVEGSTVFYKVHPSAKRYTLKDNGFTENKIRELSIDSFLRSNASEK